MITWWTINFKSKTHISINIISMRVTSSLDWNKWETNRCKKVFKEELIKAMLILLVTKINSSFQEKEEDLSECLSVIYIISKMYFILDNILILTIIIK